jgi:hypothetical protein
MGMRKAMEPLLVVYLDEDSNKAPVHKLRKNLWKKGVVSGHDFRGCGKALENRWASL